MVKPPLPVDAGQLASFLAAEAEKEPEATKPPASIYEAIKDNFDAIDKLLRVRRMTRAEVCALLATQGISIGLGTFNTYYVRAQKELGRGRSDNKAKTTRRQSADKPATIHGTGTKTETQQNANAEETPVRTAPEAKPTGANTPAKRLGGFDNKFDD